jgi:hypothetical protein
MLCVNRRVLRRTHCPHENFPVLLDAALRFENPRCRTPCLVTCSAGCNVTRNHSFNFGPKTRLWSIVRQSGEEKVVGTFQRCYVYIAIPEFDLHFTPPDKLPWRLTELRNPGSRREYGPQPLYRIASDWSTSPVGSPGPNAAGARCATQNYFIYSFVQQMVTNWRPRRCKWYSRHRRLIGLPPLTLQFFLRRVEKWF